MTQISENYALDICCIHNNQFSENEMITCNHFSLSVWLSLKCICKSYYSHFISKIFPQWCIATKRRVETHIKSLDIFNNSHSLIGGFLLDCIYNTDFSDDIDLLTNYHKMFVAYPDREAFKDRFMRVTSSIYAFGYVNAMEYLNDTRYDDSRSHSKDFNVRKFIKFGCKNIDHIVLHTIRSHKEFVNGFDFDFCKVYFDGKTLYINNIESIITKSSRIDHVAIQNSLKMASYDTRACNGKLVPYKERVEDVFIKFNLRTFKYRGRNFNIVVPENLFKKIVSVAEVL